MTNFEITVGNVYAIKAGKNTINAKVIDFDQANQTWICETESGKRIAVKSREIERFLEEIQTESVAESVTESIAESIAESVSETITEPEQKPVTSIKEIFAKANAAKIAAQYGFCTKSEADALVAQAASVAEQLNAVVKDKLAKANAAKIAAEHGFCSKELAESLAKDASDTKNALRAAGHGKVGGSIRSGMSGLDAAYKILCENVTEKNIR
ncbi:MAG: hypothetical protein LBK06_08810 [Planctomycetaceae bacterium]|jgi:uncharacterized coiled-coil DUF342 family protein|nr:hypothetical protein [Planctomycetaceae bacterium]